MSSLNTIPKNLFPQRENEYTRRWARDTYVYAHTFLTHLEPTLVPSEDEINTWRSRAIQVRSELTSIGKLAGTNKMLEIANRQYNFKIKGTNLQCTSVQDILNVVGDKDWYNEDKKTRIEQIYMLIYGITRQGFNQWVLDLEQDWMKNMNVTYVTPSGRQDLIYNSRGCVYSLLKKVFNNNVIKMFKQKMWYEHQEYICVRIKNETEDRNNINIQSIDCRWGKIYLCVKKSESHIGSNVFDKKKLSTRNSIQEQGKSWVINSLMQGVEENILQHYVRKWCESYVRTNKRKEDECKFETFSISFDLLTFNLLLH